MREMQLAGARVSARLGSWTPHTATPLSDSYMTLVLVLYILRRKGYWLAHGLGQQTSDARTLAFRAVRARATTACVPPTTNARCT